MPITPLKVLLVDKVCLASLLRIVRLGRSVGTIWHFDPLTPYQRTLLEVFGKLRLIKGEARQFERNVGDVRGEAGQGRYHELHGAAHTICSRITEKEIGPNPLVKLMSSVWAADKLLLHFAKSIESELSQECLRIGLAEWSMRTETPGGTGQCALLIERTRWFPYLRSSAQSQGVRLLSYGWPIGLGKLPGKATWLHRAVKKGLPMLIRFARGQARRGLGSFQSSSHSPKTVAGSEHAAPTLAINYYYRKLSLDPTERSEFFWLDGFAAKNPNILLYGYADDKPLSAQTLVQLKARGVRVMGQAPGVPMWSPTVRMYRTALKLVAKLAFGVLAGAGRGQWASFYYIGQLLNLSRDYAFWHDFYAANQVKVNVAVVNASVAQTLALDSLGGVSLGYQYSISTLNPASAIVAGENVQFVFSPPFEKLRRQVQPLPDFFVHTGFIYESAIAALRESGRSAEARRELQSNGVSFILCLFDESPVNHWGSTYWDKHLVAEYEYLIRWALEDPSLGIVFKPKRSLGLFQRLSPISDLIEDLDRQGRCKFLTSDSRVSGVFPAEAALMSDLCVGMLLGSTACLEGRLAGIPATLIDTLALKNHPFQAWGRGRVIFDDWDSLRTAVERYRAAPDSCPGFGDWSPGLEYLDPFQDGKASLRMGQYVGWIYQGLEEGRSKAGALALAAERYAQRWGKERVVATGGEPDYAKAMEAAREREGVPQAR